jgi:hypothetical protein
MCLADHGDESFARLSPWLSREERFLLFCCSRMDHQRIECASTITAKLHWSIVSRCLRQYPFNYVIGPLCEGLDKISSRCNISPGVQEYVRAMHKAQREENRLWLAELTRIVQAVCERGLDCVVMKGGALLAGLYMELGARKVRDLDLLFRPDQIEAAEECLRALGYSPTEEHERLRGWYLESHHHLPPFVCHRNGGRFIVEVQWVIPGRYQCPPFTERLWATSTSVNLGSLTLQIPAPEYLFLHALMDIVGHKFAKGLRPFCDLQSLAVGARSGLRWETIRDEIEVLGTQNEARLVVLLLERLLGLTLVPEARKEIGGGELPEEVVRAAEERSLHRRRDSLFIWRLIAEQGWRKRLTDLRSCVGRPEAPSAGLASSAASLFGRSLRQLYRMARSLPSAPALVRSERAEMVLDRWLQLQRAGQAENEMHSPRRACA